MHMADALISPVVGGTMWAASAGLIGYCSKKVKDDLDDARIPLMGVVGAFILAAQMINFTIPGNRLDAFTPIDSRKPMSNFLRKGD
jgi:cobalt/nickel transport system permease protein